MKTYRWAIVGTGTICSKFCGALHTVENAEIAAVCSRSYEKGSEFAGRFGISEVYTELEEMCARDDIDVVYIGTPHPAHMNAVVTAVSAGKNVLCEKPFALNERQVRASAKIAEKNGVFLMEAMWTRFLPAVRKAEEWIKSGAIGEVREVRASFRNDCPEDPESRLYSLKLGGGALLDIGVYALFAAHFGLGTKPEIDYSDVVLAGTGADKEAKAVLSYNGGKRAYVSFGFDCAACYAEFEGTSGYITVPNWCFAHSAYLFKDGELKESFCQPEDNGMRWEAIEVMRCLDEGLTGSPLYTIEDTCDIMNICDRLRAQWNLVYPNDKELPGISSHKPMNGARPFSDCGGTRTTAQDWYRDAVIYHIYPLGMCGAPEYNDFNSQPVGRLETMFDMIGYIDGLGVNAIYFGPLFESSCHGYDTANYGVIDRRLGTNELFADICGELHQRGIRIIVDGVFNHVGRDFWAFKDVRANKQNSRYKDWFNISFDGNSNYNDGFWYEGWEGHYELVRLNLHNHEVREHIFYNIKAWVEQFDIDGLRLDVAYQLDQDFLRELHGFCKGLKSDFFLLGECIHGEYNRWVNESMLDSCTNYECYKGIYSAINDGNMHEIGYSLHRQFGVEQWCLYRGLSLYVFLDNHDVTRIASILRDPELVPMAYALMYAMPGIPSIYYGSELMIKGEKSSGDNALRPMLTYDDVRRMKGHLCDYIARLSAARAQSKALRRGNYHQLYVQPKQLIFDRCYEDERVICAINTDSAPHTAHFDAQAGRMLDLLSGQNVDFGGGLVIPPKTAYIGRVY